jgi:hypothetical protein
MAGLAGCAEIAVRVCPPAVESIGDLHQPALAQVNGTPTDMGLLQATGWVELIWEQEAVGSNPAIPTPPSRHRHPDQKCRSQARHDYLMVRVEQIWSLITSVPRARLSWPAFRTAPR